MQLSVLVFSFKLAWFCLRSEQCSFMYCCTGRPKLHTSLQSICVHMNTSKCNRQVLDLRFNHVKYHYYSRLVQHVLAIEACSITNLPEQTAFWAACSWEMNAGTFLFCFSAVSEGSQAYTLILCILMFQFTNFSQIWQMGRGIKKGIFIKLVRERVQLEENVFWIL